MNILKISKQGDAQNDAAFQDCQGPVKLQESAITPLQHPVAHQIALTIVERDTHAASNDRESSKIHVTYQMISLINWFMLLSFRKLMLVEAKKQL